MAVNPVLDYLRRIRTSAQVRRTPDAELLARFVKSRDEAAFAALVQRHGPMVLRLCVRMLGDSADAEDAFQATFLVLARRGPTVSRPELLGNWLYGVAYRTALKVRADAARRLTVVKPKATANDAEPSEEASRRELRRMLDRELSGLPDRYRAPLVLHYLEGRTYEEVAQLLGCPRNTIATRMARGCERLRGQLARSGLAWSSGALAVVLSEETSAAVPTALRDATVKAALAFLAGSSALAPATIVAFAEGVMKAMFLTKVKVALGCVLLLGAVATGAGMLTHPSQVPADPAQLQATVAKTDDPFEVRSPFPGEIMEFGTTTGGKNDRPLRVGDKVSKGQLLLSIFSKDKGRFEVRSPGDGSIAEKNANLHDVVDNEKVLFRITQLKAGAAAPIQAAAPKDHADRLKPSDFTVPGLPKERVKKLLSELRPGDPMSGLVKAQYEIARTLADTRWQELLTGKSYSPGLHTDFAENFLQASQKLLQAELDLSHKGEDHLAALEAQVKRIREVEIVEKARSDAGQIHISGYDSVRLSRIRAEIWLEGFKTTGKLPADAPALPQ